MFFLCSRYSTHPNRACRAPIAQSVESAVAQLAGRFDLTADRRPLIFQHWRNHLFAFRLRILWRGGEPDTDFIAVPPSDFAFGLEPIEFDQELERIRRIDGTVNPDPRTCIRQVTHEARQRRMSTVERNDRRLQNATTYDTTFITACGLVPPTSWVRTGQLILGLFHVPHHQTCQKQFIRWRIILYLTLKISKWNTKIPPTCGDRWKQRLIASCRKCRVILQTKWPRDW